MPAAPPSSEHIADSFVFRATLRRDRLAARMALDEKARATLSARIETHLTALLTPMPPQTLSFCAPVRGEFDARPLASLLIELGWPTLSCRKSRTLLSCLVHREFRDGTTPKPKLLF